MRFCPDGPDIPPELITAQEKGETIFICGAGVSHGAGLPLFKGLVEGIYEVLGEDWGLHPAEREGMRQGGALEGQYDRVLRCLERRLAASDAPRNRGMRERIRSAVRQVLALPSGADLSNHLAILELSRDAEGRRRLITTNFDTLFERAWFQKEGMAIASHAGMAMPQPKTTNCSGILHLHGRLADPRPELNAVDSDIVLTSAEFGDAYLRTGWASRYIYDLVRAYTVVLVGYQADDPPMRYLLEALEADRERYPDLQKVYAFAACKPGDEGLVRALWEAKAVDPILYTANGEDHEALYSSLREWQKYAEDPTMWRRDRLETIVTLAPDAAGDQRIQECIRLLGHGDVCQLLGELSPSAEWLPVLVRNRVFDRGKELPGEWIAKRIHDSTMIRFCAALNEFDDQLCWHISRAIERERPNLSSLHAKAWRLLLTAKRTKRANVLDDNWYHASSAINRGEVDFDARRLVSQILRPRLEIKKAFQWGTEGRDPNAAEALHDLFRLEFSPAKHPTSKDILAAWPQVAEHELALFKVLDRTLITALEEAQEIGLIDGWDRTSYDVPSVAPHSQNAHRSGFYPITRALADLWLRIVARDPSRAREVVQAWAVSPFLLLRRLALFAHSNAVFSPTEAAAMVRKLDDEMFWGNARVEIMSLLAARWKEFFDSDRLSIEARLRQGEPRCLYAAGAFEDEKDWRSIHENSIYRRLKRIELAGGVLTQESQRALEAIASRHPRWRPGEGDRDDFHVWHEMRSGPSARPELLASISDERLVQEALRLQREQHFEQGDVWRAFCAADPERALRGLQLEAKDGRWEVEGWRCVLSAASEKGDVPFQFALADLILEMPIATLDEILPTAASWLERQRESLSCISHLDGMRFFSLWDRFADLTFSSTNLAPEAAGKISDDLVTEALNRPGGILASSLLAYLFALNLDPGSGIDEDLRPRFERLAAAQERPGLLARVYLVRSLADLDAIDPAWTKATFEARLVWGHPEALPLWHSYASGDIGSARLFNALKPAVMLAFEQHELSDDEFESLTSRLLSVAVWHQRGEATEYDLTTAEVRRALTVGPTSARRNASWNLWRMMASSDDDVVAPTSNEDTSQDRSTRWRTVIGPLFHSIWPLDARLRSKDVTRNLVLMAMECDEAFPEAVKEILDVVVPYELYMLSHSLRLDEKHSELVRHHPLAFVRLVNALIDPVAFAVPSDLGTFLQECVTADQTVANDPAYVRLFGLRRQRNA